MNLETSRFRGLQTAWLQNQKKNSPLLIFLHGYPDSPQIWSYQSDYFGEKYSVLCPFARGVGLSESSAAQKRFGCQPTSLDWLQMIEKAQSSPKQKVVLVGHDMGAAQAWHLAPYLGKRLAGLISLNGLSARQMWRRLRDPSQILRSWYIYGIQVPRVAESLCSRFPRQMENFAYWLGGLPKDRRPSPEAPKSQLRNPLKQYRALLMDLMRQKVPDAKIECPVLFLWGKRDPFLVPPTEQEFASASPNVTIRILEAGHWLQRERAREVNRHIEDFLKANHC